MLSALDRLPYTKNYFKVAVSRDFLTIFFFETNPPEPLINKLKRFC